jgi:glycosyltransferase involved in cell wall biosynthesis
MHPVDDPSVLLVHVTPFNQLMWDAGRTPSTVIEHGVVVPAGVSYTGEREAGLVVVNHLARRGRRLGADVFAAMREELPLDLVGMGAEELGGRGEIPPMELARFEASYRFFLHPVRWTSLGLALCEAMMIGMPIVGLATTELVTVVENGVSGFIDTDPARLTDAARFLLGDHDAARQLGAAGQRIARARFGIERFIADWHRALALVTGTPIAGVRQPLRAVPA